MANLPKTHNDPTLEAVHAAYQARASIEPDRPYLGMSGIGHKCLRKHWYGFRWCSRQTWEAATLYRFDDGHRSEDIMAERLRLVDGIELQTLDQATGRQIGFSDHGGHFRGHADGIINGLLQAPRTRHVWEHKCVNDAKFRKLINLIDKLGEKQAMEAWDETYFVQGQLYMHYSGLKRHYLTCATPGTRDVTSVRTNYNSVVAKAFIERAGRVIQADTPPERVSDDPSFWLCKWCHHAELCHGDRVAMVNCRTCLHSTPVIDGKDGTWRCDKLQCDLPVEVQRNSGCDKRPCQHHRFIPKLIPFAEVNDASEEDNFVEYRNKADGRLFVNGSGDMQCTSIDIQRAGKMITDEVICEIKKPSADISTISATSQNDSSSKWSAAANAGTTWLTQLETGQESGDAK